MTAIVLAAPAPARAQPVSPEPGDAATAKPGLLKQIGIDQRLQEQVPLDLAFKDEAGRDVRLGDYFGKRPVILVLGYYECPMLCTQVLNAAVSALSLLTFDAGREFDVVAVSINPKETPALAAQKKQSYMERYDRPHTVEGWHFLTGTEASIQRLAASVGFRYAFDEEIQQYAHAAVIEVLTPRGVISKYFYGIEFSARDLKFGADGSVRGADRHGGRQRPAALLPLRPDDREVRRVRDRRRPRRGGGDRAGVSVVSVHQPQTRAGGATRRGTVTVNRT